MAIIGKIRSHSRLLVGIIGLALLFFVFSNFFETIPQAIQKWFSGEVEYGIGTVYGEKADENAYIFYSTNFELNDKNQAVQTQKDYTQKDRENSQNKAWEYMVDSTILSKEYASLKISVSEKEFNDYLFATDGFKPLPDLEKDFFRDSIGNLTEKSISNGRNKLKSEIKRLKSSKDPQVVKQWKGIKETYTNRRKQEKYFDLLDQGIYVTNLEAEEEYIAQKKTKNISFVVRRYDEIKDVDVQVSESDIKKYYEQHKSDKKYANLKPSREVKLFDVKVTPSKKDSSLFINELNILKDEFIKSSNDSLFVSKNSENKYYSGKLATAVPEGHPKANKTYQSYPTYLDSAFKKASIGQIIGPYQMQENAVYSKVIGFTPEKLKARHILIATNNSTDEKVIKAKRKIADSLLRIINKDNFPALVKKFTDDPGSKETGGLYDDFLESEMVAEFSSFCATQPIGKIGIVKTAFGFHIIEVLDRSSAKFPLLVSISKKIKLAEETVYAREKEVTDILYELDEAISKVNGQIKKSELFDKIATKNKYAVRSIIIEDNSPKIDGFINNSTVNKLIKFAYSNKATVGSLVNSPIVDKDNYILAMIVNIKLKGAPKYDDIREKMKEDLMIEIKAEKLIKSMSKYKTMDGLTKAFNSQVLNAEISFSNPQITGGGYEPEIIGSLFASIIKDKTQTLPLKGKTGVYVVRIDKTTNPPVAANYKVERDQMYTALKGSVQGQAIGALRKKADIIDNRKLHDLKIRK